MPETLAGGNSIASGQTFLVPAESAVETVKTYLLATKEDLEKVVQEVKA